MQVSAASYVLFLTALLLVPFPGYCVGEDHRDADLVKKQIVDLREVVAKRHGRGSWVPKGESGIVLHDACHRHATGCPAEYLTWLMNLAPPAEHAKAPVPVQEPIVSDARTAPAPVSLSNSDDGIDLRRMCSLDEQTAAQASTEALLRDRLEQLEQDRHRLLDARSAAQQRRNVECSGRDDSDAFTDRLAHHCRSVLSEGLQFATVCSLAWLRWATAFLLPSSIVVALLFWLCFDLQIVPEFLRHAWENDWELWRRHRLVLAYSEHGALHFVAKLRLLILLLMTLGVAWSLWDLHHIVHPTILPWGLQYIIPTPALFCVVIFAAFVAVAPVGYMLRETNMAWHALCEVYNSDCAMVQRAVG